jgi:hypothetical protein
MTVLTWLRRDAVDALARHWTGYRRDATCTTSTAMNGFGDFHRNLVAGSDRKSCDDDRRAGTTAGS